MFSHPLLPSDPFLSLLDGVSRLPACYSGEMSTAGAQLVNEDLTAPVPSGAQLSTLNDLLVDAVARSIENAESVGVLATGGLDSALIASVVRQVTGIPPTLICATAGLTSTTEDLKATELAAVLGSRLVRVGTFDLANAFGIAVDSNRGSDFPLGGVFSAIWSGLASSAENLGVDVLVTGEGGNELFSCGEALAVDLWRMGRRRDSCLQFGRARGTNRAGYWSSLRHMRRTNCLPTKAWDDPQSEFPVWYGRSQKEFADSSKRWRNQIKRMTDMGYSFSETVCAARLERLELWGPNSLGSNVTVAHPLADPRLRRFYFRSGLAFNQSFGVAVGDKYHARLLARRHLPTSVADQPKVGPANQLSALRALGLSLPKPSTNTLRFLGFSTDGELAEPESLPASMGLDWTSAYAFLAWAEANVE